MSEETLDSYEQEVTLRLRKASKALTDAVQEVRTARGNLDMAEYVRECALKALANANLDFRRVVLREYIPDEPATKPAFVDTSPDGLMAQ